MENPDHLANTGKFQVLQKRSIDVGLTLRQAREGLDMSVHDIAERIKFAPRQVEALEANDFTHLPKATFLRGFVRSYARVLQLDEVALIAALPTDPTHQDMVNAHASEVVFPKIQSLRRINLLWLTGALGVGLVLGGFLLIHDSEPTTKTSELVVKPLLLATPDPAVSSVAQTELQIEPSETVKISEPNKVPELVKVIVPPIPKEPIKEVKPVVNSISKIVTSSATVTLDKSTASLEILKRRPLHLVFVDSTWAEVIDAHGVVLLSRNNPRGSEKWIGGPHHSPYDITIARPSSVKLYLRGKEVNLSAYAGMEVAHLKLD